MGMAEQGGLAVGHSGGVNQNRGGRKMIKWPRGGERVARLQSVRKPIGRADSLDASAEGLRLAKAATSSLRPG
jgi:hypothetical protein